jgi:hypothetical protein
MDRLQAAQQIIAKRQNDNLDYVDAFKSIEAQRNLKILEIKRSQFKAVHEILWCQFA